MKRAEPDTWLKTLRAYVRVNAQVRHRYLDDWLVYGASGDLLPKGPKDESFKSRRASARRWLPYCGVLIESIDGTCLRSIIDRRCADGQSGAPATFRRDCMFLRRWVKLAQKRNGFMVRLEPKWKHQPSGAASAAPSRTTDLATLDDVAVLLALCPKDVRVMIGLALGCRLSTHEITWARFENMAPDYATILIDGGGRRGRPRDRGVVRQVALPLWLQDLARVAWGTTPPTTDWCFPGRSGKRRSQLDAVLRRIREKAGLSITFEELRRIGQAVARACDASRVTVRGVVRGKASSGATNPEADVFAVQQKVLAASWTRLLEPPREPERIPARAPKGCGATEPEVEAARQQVRRFADLLPDSCRPRTSTGPASLAVTASLVATAEAEAREATVRAEQAEAALERAQEERDDAIDDALVAAPIIPAAVPAGGAFTSGDVLGAAVLGVVGGVIGVAGLKSGS